MFTSAECQARAEKKLAEAEHDPQHKTRLRNAAEAWLFLANRLIRAEGEKRRAGSFLVDQIKVSGPSQFGGLVTGRAGGTG